MKTSNSLKSIRAFPSWKVVWIGRLTVLACIAYAFAHTRAAIYPFAAAFGPAAFQNGSNDVLVSVGLRPVGHVLGTNGQMHSKVPTTNGTGVLHINIPDDLAGVTRYWLS